MAVKNASDLTTYTYNADGLRTSKTVYGTKTEYYRVDGVLLGEKTGENQIMYLYDESSTPYAMVYNGVYYYYIRNQQGDVIGILDADGNIIVNYEYSAWGEILSITGSHADTIGQLNPLRYRGYYYDNETGFYYLQSRYYDPVTCRFINADGYVSTGQGITGYNMFAYCGNNPVSRADLTGEFFVTISTIAGYAIVAIGTMFCISSVLTNPQVQAVTTQAVDSIAIGISHAISSAKIRRENKAKEKEKEAVSTPPPKTRTYYHVTSPEIAAQIIATNMITAGEGGYVYAWQRIPSKTAINNSGSRFTGRGTVTIAFETIVAFETDPTMNEYTYMFGPVRTYFPGSIYVSNPRIVRNN